MKILTFSPLKFRQLTTKRKITNLLVLVSLLALVMVVGYFIGKKIPTIDFSLLMAGLGLNKKAITQAPTETGEEMEKIEIILSKTYEQEARPGEGITHLARRALKEYLVEKGQGLNLTPEHKIYIEDYLQNKTGDFWLKVGQKLTFSEELIKEAIEHAQQLTPEQLQNLTQYSQLVPELNY